MVAVSGFPQFLHANLGREILSSSQICTSRDPQAISFPPPYALGDPQNQSQPGLLKVSVDMSTPLHSLVLSDENDNASSTLKQKQQFIAPSRVAGLAKSFHPPGHLALFLNSTRVPDSVLQELILEEPRLDQLNHPFTNQPDEQLVYPSDVPAGFGKFEHKLVTQSVPETLRYSKTAGSHLNTMGSCAFTGADLDHLSTDSEEPDEVERGSYGFRYAVEVQLPLTIKRQHGKQSGHLFNWAKDLLKQHYIDIVDVTLSEFMELFANGVALDVWIVNHLQLLTHRQKQRGVASQGKLTKAVISPCTSETQHDVFAEIPQPEQSVFITSFKLLDARITLAEEGLTLSSYELEDFAEASLTDQQALIKHRKIEERDRQAERQRVSQYTSDTAEPAPASSSKAITEPLDVSEASESRIQGGVEYDVQCRFYKDNALKFLLPVHEELDKRFEATTKLFGAGLPRPSPPVNPFYNPNAVGDISLNLKPLTSRPIQEAGGNLSQKSVEEKKYVLEETLLDIQEAGPSTSRPHAEEVTALRQASLPNTMDFGPSTPQNHVDHKDAVLKTEVSNLSRPGASSAHDQPSYDTLQPEARSVLESDQEVGSSPEQPCWSTRGAERQDKRDDHHEWPAISAAHYSLAFGSSKALQSCDSACSRRAIHRTNSDTASTESSCDSDEYIPLECACPAIACQAREVRKPLVRVIEVIRSSDSPHARKLDGLDTSPFQERKGHRIEFSDSFVLPKRSARTSRRSQSCDLEFEDDGGPSVDGRRGSVVKRTISQFFGSLRAKKGGRSSLAVLQS